MGRHRRETFGRSRLAERAAHRYLCSGSRSVLPDIIHRKAACLIMIGDPADANIPRKNA